MLCVLFVRYPEMRRGANRSMLEKYVGHISEVREAASGRGSLPTTVSSMPSVGKLNFLQSRAKNVFKDNILGMLV